jgi:hypothetical protein
MARMTPILWAGLVAIGVAVASMAIFAARLTRKASARDAAVEEFVPSADPDDPWAAYRPRPFEDVERRRRPRVWPAIAGVFGLVLVAGGVVGARQSTQLTTLEAAPTTKPYIVDVKPPSTPEPTLAPTPPPTAPPTAKPAYRPAVSRTTTKPSVSTSSGTGPKLSGFMSCSGGTLHTSISVSGTKLSWFGLYVDGKVVKGGPISGSSYSTGYSKPASKGDHTAEATADDAAGHHSRKILTAHCS